MTGIFVSSVQKELQAERFAIRDFVHADPLLRRFFKVFLFENLPASDRRADRVYLDEVDRCGVYVGIFGNEYGYETGGISPTEREFDRATGRGKPRLIFIKGGDDRARHPKMLALIRKAGEQLIRRRFVGLVEHLERDGAIRTMPFDASTCPRATLSDISDEKVRWFLAASRRERQYSLKESATTPEALAHLNLLDQDDHRRPTQAAVLLFGKSPQRFLPTSEIKCMHFHGAEIRKPIPSYQIYKGNLFDLVDQAVDFVMSKINRTVGTRAEGPQAPVTYDLPKDAVTEAIVNAVVHRDYTSNASVQVMLFADRLEVWNPGQLPPSLTPALLRRPHASIPHNPLVAEPMFLTRYIEKAGTGTLDMISLCREAGLPEPEYRQDGGQFVQTLWRDWLTEEVVAGLGLEPRQREAVALLKKTGRLDNKSYQEAFAVSKPTATRALDGLLRRGILQKKGTTGKGTYYVLNPKGLTKGSNDSSRSGRKKPARKRRPAQ
ncbi:MAG TPA: ATP-binding protein [Elusimicrobiota bacterium]|nr:ATP-binding protein [Elusimicrobiota bacterium]